MNLKKFLQKAKQRQTYAVGTNKGFNFLRIGLPVELKLYLKNYLDREVVEIYPRAGSNIVNVIIQGDEQGKFWFEHEQETRS